MGLKSYKSSEEKYGNVIDILKSLPREKAPDNFEFKLFARIENKSFEIKTGETVTSFRIPAWVYAPVAAVVLSLIAFVIVTDVGNFNIKQPLNAAQNTVALQKPAKKKNAKIKAILIPDPNYRVVVNQNDAVVKEKVSIPIDPSKAVSLDNYIAGKNAKAKRQNSLNHLVSQEAGYFRFNGFFPIDRDFQTLEKLRARMDSIMNMWEMNRINSLNRN